MKPVCVCVCVCVFMSLRVNFVYHKISLHGREYHHDAPVPVFLRDDVCFCAPARF